MYDINFNILSRCGLSAKQLKDAINAVSPGNKISDAQDFLNAEAKYGVNALFMIAHAAIESAWGTSYYARTRNNLFGFNAVDSNPNNASSYTSQAAAVDYYASFLKQYYLTPGAIYFNGDTPHGVFVKYSSSHDTEAQSVVGIMNLLAAHTGTSEAQRPAPTPTPQVSGNDYVVKSGDSLWGIANAYGLSLARLIQLNPQIGNPNLIYPGQVVHVSGNQPAPTPAPAARTYTIKSGDTLSGIASQYGMSWQALYSRNQGVIGSNPNRIFPGQVLTI